MRIVLAIIFALACVMSEAQTNAANTYYMFVGSYGSAKSDGIHVYRFNAQRGFATLASKLPAENASFMVASPDQRFVYVVNEIKGKEGTISAYAFDKAKGTLRLLNTQPTGVEPCYISIDSTGRFLFVAEYGSGGISVYKIASDGSVQPKLQSIKHDGYGIVYERQDQSHVHSVMLSPDQRFLFAADLGNDRLYQYVFDRNNATEPLTPAPTPYYAVADGAGPRHIVFHPNGKHLYLINELTGDVVVFDYNGAQLQEVQTIASATAGGKHQQGSADIHVSPNSKFLFTSNRGVSNNVVTYLITKEGKLNKSGEIKVNDHPRNFAIDPTGKFLLVASKDKNTVQIFSINPNFGLLEETSQKIEVDQPVFVMVLPAR